MPNAFAYLVILGFPFVAVALFHRLPRPQAVIWTILGGYLFLPTSAEFDLPVLPPIDKDLVPALSAFLLCLLPERRPRRRPGPARPETAAASTAASTGASATASTANGAAGPVPARRASREAEEEGWAADGEADGVDGEAAGGGDAEAAPRRVRSRLLQVLLAVTLGVPLLTLLNNRDPLVYGPTVLPGLSLYDALGTVMAMLATLLPFLLGRRYLGAGARHTEILRAFLLAGLAYSVLMLIEIRLSPQLNVWLYGFFPHHFDQHIRAGGYRPIVFLDHGLWVGIFTAMALLAAAGYRRQLGYEGRRSLWGFATAWLAIILVLAKSFGALMMSLMLLPLVMVSTRRLQMTVATCIALGMLAYPVLRGSGLVPVEAVVEWAAKASEERASSLQFRLDNEDQLLARASLKPVTGWGSWGRQQIFNAEGEMTSVTDGSWIIVIGQSGWVGYLAEFGLLTLPVLLLARRRRRFNLGPATTALALVLALNIADLIPNATLTPLTFLIAGALWGRHEIGLATLREEAAAARNRPHHRRPRRSRTASPGPKTALPGRPAAAGPAPAGGLEAPLHKRRPRG